jgi:hypothetical protein
VSSSFSIFQDNDHYEEFTLFVNPGFSRLVFRSGVVKVHFGWSILKVEIIDSWFKPMGVNETTNRLSLSLNE